MLISFAIIFCVALLLSTLFNYLKLPGILGMLVAGVLIGPHCLGWLSIEFLDNASELRSAGLIVILIRAGLGINKSSLKKIGLPALKMSLIPCLLEGTVVMVAVHFGLGLPLAEAGLLAFILSAVSPAVIVPQMLNLIQLGYGRQKGVPTLVLAGASIDDVFAITMFGVFLGIVGGGSQDLIMGIAHVPVKIGLGLATGWLLGYLMVLFFSRYHSISDTRKMMFFMVLSVFLYDLEKRVPIASLVGIMALGYLVSDRNPDLGQKMAHKFSKAWCFAEIVLFVLVGAQVNLKIAFASGLTGLIIIFIGLCGRSVGVIASLAGSELNSKERLFCIMAYVPKATVQAAIGAIPLTMGIPSGDFILAVAVLSIVVTAPLGAIMIKTYSKRLLGNREPVMPIIKSSFLPGD